MPRKRFLLPKQKSGTKVFVEIHLHLLHYKSQVTNRLCINFMQLHLFRQAQKYMANIYNNHIAHNKNEPKRLHFMINAITL